MSWNIQTPGDYINGPLTVTGSATITGNLTVAGNGPHRFGTSNYSQFDQSSLQFVGSRATPGALSIYGNTNRLIFQGDTGGYLFQNAANTLTLLSITNDATQLTVNSTGLGVGTASPSFNIHARGTTDGRIQVEGASGYGMVFVQASSGNTAQIQLNSNGGSGRRYLVGSNSSGQFLISDETAVATRLLIDSSGNVGVGVTPVAGSGKFQTVGGITYDGQFDIISALTNVNPALGAAKGVLLGYNNTTNNGIISAAYGNGTEGLQFWTHNGSSWGARMTLDASGNLLVGTTSGNFGSRLIISADSGTTRWATGPLPAGPLNYYITANNTQGVFLNGTGATAWTAISDERYKDIIEPITNAVSKVGSLRSVIGKFKTDAEGTRRSFLIAQDVLAAFPEAAVATDPEKLGVTYTEVIPLLVAAIKELTARVQTIESR